MNRFVGLAAIGAFAASYATAKDSCVFVDFTAEASDFEDLNAALDLVQSFDLLGAVLGKHDPLVIRNLTLSSFKYSILGQQLTITPSIDTINITGLTNVAPDNITVTSENSVDISAYSADQVSVDATLRVATNLLGTSATARVAFGMKKPAFMANVQANMYACAPGVSTSQCSNATVAGLQAEVVKEAVFGNIKSVFKKLLMKFEDASVRSFQLDFASASEFAITFDSDNFVLSAISNLLTDYSKERVNEKGAVYNTLLSAINLQAPVLLNDMIINKFKPMFGKTCLSEED